jgi:hypothetical protein
MPERNNVGSSILTECLEKTSSSLRSPSLQGCVSEGPIPSYEELIAMSLYEE